MTHFDRTLLIHVAAESERRGRVVVASRTARPHLAALDAAFVIAGAFDTWVECLLLECPDVVALTAHTFARVVSHAGRISPLSGGAVQDAQSAMTLGARTMVMAKGKASGVRVATTVARDGLIDAMARACAVEGPWNIIGLAEPVRVHEGAWLRELLNTVGGATGIVCVGPNAATISDEAGRGGGAVGHGALIVVVEDLDRLPQMLRAAERLAERADGHASSPVSIVAVGGTFEETQRLEGQLRLMLADIPHDPKAPVALVETGAVHGTPEELAEGLRRLNGRFVIARCGGIAMPSNGDTAAVLGVLRCPLLLVR